MKRIAIACLLALSLTGCANMLNCAINNWSHTNDLECRR
jgi:hypothetical protein